MSDSNTCLGLEKLVEEYQLACDLEQHHEVSDLGTKICIELVQLIDKELQGKEDDTEDEPNCLPVIEILCQLLRDRSYIASTYGNVIDFVRTRVSTTCCLYSYL